MSKVIITAAITGSIHVPSMSPYLPQTPAQIIDECVRSHEAGAAVVHIHARNPADGVPSSSQEIYGEILSGVKARSDVVVCVSTGGSPSMTAEERLAAVSRYKPEMASLNAGSLNFALYPIAAQVKEFKYPWEKAYLENTDTFVFTNNFKMLKQYCETMYECETKQELEIYDVGMINNLAQLISEGILKRPIYLQYVMGILGGIPATVDNLLYLYNTCVKQLGDFQWSVCAAGRHQFTMGVTNMILGGNMRVGLEDNLYLERGVLAKSNAQQVEKAIRLARELGLEPASPADARKMLGLKGLDRVNY